MASVSVRGLDGRVKDRLRVRAARHGRSMEAEIRAILTAAVAADGGEAGLLASLRQRFAEIGGVDLELPPRGTPPRAPSPPG